MGQGARALRNLARAVQLNDDPALRSAYDQLQAHQFEGTLPGADSTAH